MSRGVELVGSRVLDLYAGSGALAFESLSRGAAEATVVEFDAEASRTIAANAQRLGLAPRVTLLRMPAARASTRFASGRPFSVVFADPPYADLLEASVVLEHVAAFVRGGATLVLEHASRDRSPTLSAWRFDTARVYGDTSLAYYVRDE
jgi:16S rRNA (guanine966-N2)-methyltransferase